MNPHSSRASGRYSFPKEKRLLRPAEYRSVYDHGTRRNLDFLVAFALRNDSGASRVGVTVPRTVGGAVQRNRIKRRLREAVRRHFDELGLGWDVVFNARQSALNQKFAAIEQAVSKFFALCAGGLRRPTQGGNVADPRGRRAAP